jgi:antitoxin YefM
VIAIAYAQFRRKMGEVVENAIHLGEHITVTRADGKNFVIVSEDEWDAVNETAHLISSDKNIRRLRESADQAKAGKLVERVID